MEEGPEPQEWVERTAEHQHHEHESSHAPPEQRREMTTAAITAALLAVLAAFGSLLSGHAANEAILAQTKASDQWAYYQAKSTKGHLYEVSREVVAALGKNQGEQVQPVLERFEKQVARYDHDKGEIEEKARDLEHDSEHQYHKHHYYALGIAIFQVGIVLSSVSILVRLRLLYGLSVAAGIVGVVFLATGLLA